MADDYTLRVKRFDPADGRLGRHVCHDSRSLRFRAPARDPRTLSSIRHRVYIPIMDQGNLGSCTGHAGTNVMASEAFFPVGEPSIGPGDPHVYAVHLYADATAIDPWPGSYLPDDTGSDGLSIAKVLHGRGLISGYEHAFSLEATLTALAERVVMIGTEWRTAMYDVAADGRMTVAGDSAGGHEYALDELDVENRRVWIRNSWGQGWGVGGRAYLTWDDLGTLLAADGDCTVLVPLALPAPLPVPVPPKPDARAEDALLAVALAKFVRTHQCPAYVRKPAESWLATISKE